MKNSAYEHALICQGITFSYTEKFELKAIDAPKSMRNQARLNTPIEGDLVNSYQIAMENGAEFPPLVIYKPNTQGSTKYVIIDGNQRYTAAQKAKRLIFDAYIVVVTDQKVIDRLTWSFNNLVNGRRLTVQESVEHAVSYIRKYNYPEKQAVKEWSVPAWRVRMRLSVLKAEDILNRHNVKKTPALTDDVLTRLLPISSSGEDVFIKAVKTLGEAAVTQPEVSKLSSDVASAKTHDDKMKVIEEFATSPLFLESKAETKSGTIKTSKQRPCDTLARVIREANNLFERFPDKASLIPRSVDYKSQRQLAYDLVERLSKLFGLGAAHKENTGS